MSMQTMNKTLTSSATCNASVIEIAVTPVFMLVGIAGFLAVLIARHGRTVDRSRALQKVQAITPDEASLVMVRREQSRLLRRMFLSHFAISLATFSAIIVCLVVVTLFVGHLLATVARLISRDSIDWPKLHLVECEQDIQAFRSALQLTVKSALIWWKSIVYAAPLHQVCASDKPGWI